jgi:hypothetical protein
MQEGLVFACRQTAIYCGVKVVFTNTVPVDAYRGAGRPEATFVLERLVDGKDSIVVWVRGSRRPIAYADLQRRHRPHRLALACAATARDDARFCESGANFGRQIFFQFDRQSGHDQRSNGEGE